MRRPATFDRVVRATGLPESVASRPVPTGAHPDHGGQVPANHQSRSHPDDGGQTGDPGSRIGHHQGPGRERPGGFAQLGHGQPDHDPGGHRDRHGRRSWRHRAPAPLTADQALAPPDAAAPQLAGTPTVDSASTTPATPTAPQVAARDSAIGPLVPTAGGISDHHAKLRVLLSLMTVVIGLMAAAQLPASRRRLAQGA